MERKEEDRSLGVALGEGGGGGGRGGRRCRRRRGGRDPASALRGGERRAERGRSAKGSRGTCPKSHGCCSLAGSRPVVA